MLSAFLSRSVAGLLFLGGTVLILSGCANHTWAPGPNVSAADFEPTRARCSLLARNSGSSFAASGDARFVAGATLGNAVGESVRANQNFNDCMLASGFLIADETPETASRVQLYKERMASLGAVSKQCISSIRAAPQYEILSSHMSELGTGKYTIVQLANEQVPTPAESDAMAAYLDRASTCQEAFFAGVEKLQPAVGSVLREAQTMREAAALLLIKRKISWGDYAVRQKEVTEWAFEKLKHIQI